MDERLYCLGFSVFSGIGPIRFLKLLDRFGTAAEAWNAGAEDLREAGLGDILTKRFDEFRGSFSLRGYFQKLRDLDIKFFTSRDPEYPRLLAKIKTPPFVLYIKGDYKILKQVYDDRFIAIVGTRKITFYGLQVTELLVNDLVDAGFVIVSGLAIGVDSRAHAATLARNGKTIAVLGSGVDRCFPAANIQLYRKILEKGGSIVSEFPLGRGPVKGSFPSRNRIIAGLCAGVVVTEGTEDSGALITAKDAFESGRKVFAVPGPITSNYSRGPNSLIARGALPVGSTADILRALKFKENPRVRKIRGDTKEEQIIIDFLKKEQLHVNALIKTTGIQAAEIGTILSLMEMKGLVRNLGSGIFALSDFL